MRHSPLRWLWAFALAVLAFLVTSLIVLQPKPTTKDRESTAPTAREAAYEGAALFHSAVRIVQPYGDRQGEVGYGFLAEGDGSYDVPGRVVTDGRGRLYVDDPVHGVVQVYGLHGEHVGTISVDATQLGADPTGKVYGIVRGGVAVFGAGASPQVRPFKFVSPEVLRVSPDGTVLVRDSASESARIVALHPDGTVEELTRSPMFFSTADGRKVELRSPVQGQQQWEVLVSMPTSETTLWSLTPQLPDGLTVLWRFELIGIDAKHRAYFHRQVGVNPPTGGSNGLRDFIDIMDTDTGQISTIPIASSGQVASPSRGDGLFVDSGGRVYQLVETPQDWSVTEYQVEPNGSPAAAH